MGHAGSQPFSKNYKGCGIKADQLTMDVGSPEPEASQDYAEEGNRPNPVPALMGSRNRAWRLEMCPFQLFHSTLLTRVLTGVISFQNPDRFSRSQRN
jgi:hypothetical protein